MCIVVSVIQSGIILLSFLLISWTNPLVDRIRKNQCIVWLSKAGDGNLGIAIYQVHHASNCACQISSNLRMTIVNMFYSSFLSA